MSYRATQDGWVMVERADRMWSTGERNGKPLQYSCLENHMNSMKRHSDRILKEELPRSVGSVSSLAQSCPALCNTMNCSTPGLLVHHQLSEFTQTHAHPVGDAIQHLILCPLLLLPPIPPSITVFSNESTLCMRLSKYWSFSFSISPSSEHSGLISFRMDCLVLLAAQWSLKSLLQHNSSKASMFWCSAFFTVQLAHPYMTTGKTKALTRQTFVGEVMSLCFNMLSRLVITFLPL